METIITYGLLLKIIRQNLFASNLMKQYTHIDFVQSANVVSIKAVEFAAVQVRQNKGLRTNMCIRK